MAGRAVTALLGAGFIAFGILHPEAIVVFCLALAVLLILGGVLHWVATGEEWRP